MSMTVPVGRRANERQSKGCSFLVVFFGQGEWNAQCCAAELTLQPCGCLSGCAHRLKGPARVYPSGPEATLAPPTSLVEEKQGQRFKDHSPPQKNANPGVMEALPSKGKSLMSVAGS